MKLLRAESKIQEIKRYTRALEKSTAIKVTKLSQSPMEKGSAVHNCYSKKK